LFAIGGIRADSRRLGQIGFPEFTGDVALARPIEPFGAEVLCREFWRWTEQPPRVRGIS